MKLFNLEKKIAVVTGAGSGIGQAIAIALAGAGAKVYVTDLDAKGGRKTVAQITAEKGAATFLPLDVTQADECLELAHKITGKDKQIDILVNNAGIGSVGSILETTGEDMDRLYAVNVRGIFNLSKAVMPKMIEAKGGSVINLASIGGVVGIRDRFAYCMSKFAVVGMTKAMAMDHSHLGIRINCICPGRVETPFVKARLTEYPDPAKAYQEMASTQLMGRMGKPEEIAAAALYLASDEAALVTGSTLMIDGGWSAGK